MKILIIRPGAMGDLILTIPVLRAIRQKYPDAQIELLGTTGYMEVAKSLNVVNTTRECSSMFVFGYKAKFLHSQVIDYLGMFDLIVSYLLSAHIQSREVLLSKLKPTTQVLDITDMTKHSEVDRIVSVITPLNLPVDVNARLDVQLTGDKNSPIAILTGTGGKIKEWTTSNWQKLITDLYQKYPLLLIGGKAEKETVAQIAMLAPNAEQAVGLSLPILIQKLSRCRAFIGLETGLSHLSGMMGLPGVVLWALPSYIRWWIPRPGVTILQSGGIGIKTITPEQVEIALDVCFAS